MDQERVTNLIASVNSLDIPQNIKVARMLSIANERRPKKAMRHLKKVNKECQRYSPTSQQLLVCSGFAGVVVSAGGVIVSTHGLTGGVSAGNSTGLAESNGFAANAGDAGVEASSGWTDFALGGDGGDGGGGGGDWGGGGGDGGGDGGDGGGGGGE
jgi:hypothetical protein